MTTTHLRFWWLAITTVALKYGLRAADVVMPWMPLAVQRWYFSGWSAELFFSRARRMRALIDEMKGKP